MERPACTCVVLCCLWLVAPAAPAGAQEVAAAAPAADAVPAATFSEASLAAAQTTVRPRSLVPLYVSFASLQAMDVHSTMRALDRGAVEANPLMKGLAGNPIAFTAAKVAGSAGVIYAAEKMRKKHPKTAVVFMIAANAAMALVVSHNYRQR